MLGLFMTLDSGLVEHTIENSRKINQSFEEAISFVTDYENQNQRLPTQAEFQEWSSSFPRRPYSPNDMEIILNEFPKEVTKRFGAPSKNGFALSLWRGEWSEYYVSWQNKTTLTFDRSDYYALGSPIKDATAIVLIGGLVVLLALCLRPKRLTNKSTRTA